MYYLCSIRKRDYKPIKLNDMKVRKLYELRIINPSIEQGLALRNFLNSLGILFYYEYYTKGDKEICIEHLNKQEYSKISNFLKTL